MNAKVLLQEVFKSGMMIKKKAGQEHLKRMKQQFQEAATEKREVFGKKVVVRTVPIPVYETDHAGLAEFLDDIGLLPKVVRLTPKDMKNHDPDLAEALKVYVQKRKGSKAYYAKINLRKPAKQQVQAEIERSQEVHENLDNLASRFEFRSLLDSYLERKEKRVKWNMLRDPVFLEKRKAEIDIASASAVKKDERYDIERMYQEGHDSILLEYGSIQVQQLDEFMLKGFLNKSDVDAFRKVIDMKYVTKVMTIRSEDSMFEEMNRQRNQWLA